MSLSLPLLMNSILLTFLAALALGVARARELFVIVMLSGVYSLTIAVLFTLLDAVDVAFTEAAIGAGFTTILFFAAITLTMRHESPPVHSTLPPLLVCVATGAILLYAIQDLPPHGNPAAAVHTHIAPDYLARAPGETNTPNVVTAILASYRGFDTLGEVVVIFTGGIATLMLIGKPLRRRARRRAAAKTQKT